MKMRRVLALVMAVLMVIGLMPAISAVHNQEPVEDGYFTVTKTAEATDIPGVYDIKVTVAPKGKANVVSGDVEVVFLLDTSSSMAWCTETNPNHAHTGTSGYDTEGKRCEVSARDITKERLHIAKTAINKMISSLNTAFQNSGSTLTVSVVTYASESSVKVDKAVVTNETLEQITKKVSDISSLGGTYMESGLKKANLQFSSGNSSKYLIMIGDGDYNDEDYFDGFLFWGEWNYATDRIKNAASAITKKGATLMTVGFTQDIAIFKEIASKDSNGQPMYSRADSDVTLNNILEGITEKISADGIVLEDYVGDNNSIVDTQKVDVDYGVIESSSTNNIKWNIPSENADKMTLKYRISVDPSKLNAGLNENVPLNGTTKLTYKVAEGDPQEITVQPPTDDLTVAKLYVEYYLDGNFNGDMSRYVESKFRNNDPITFDFGKPEDTLTVGEGDGATTYKFEKAVQLDDNNTEIPLAFTDNGMTTVNVYNDIQVVRVYYVTEKPEMPEPPQWLGMVTVKCVNGEAGHEEKTYEINTGDYTVLDGGVTEVNGEYQYRINLINARYLSAYNADTVAEHKLAENKATEVKFVYEKETGKWTHENPIIKVICESEPEMPEPPEIMAMVTVKCINEKAGHEEKAYEVNTGDYTVLNGGVVEVDGTYQYVINLLNSKYLSAYNTDTGAEHKLAENKATEIVFTFEKETGRWIHENPIIEVICESHTEPSETYTVTYTDGVENEVVFADQVYTDLKSGVATPAFNGYLIRDGYTFAGWNPNVSETVTKNVTYTAQWKLNSDTPIDPPFIVLFPTLEISNKVIAPKNFEKTSFEYDIINVKTGDVEKSVTLKADSSVRVMVTGGTEYMVVPKNLDVPGYIVTTTSTPDSATVTSDKIGNVSVDFTHIYVVGLNTEDHYAYIRGYEDGTIRPEGNITRAEVATIFYRLLSSEALAAFKTTENTFTDVDSDAWYNLSVSTLAKAGVISGYPDGSFNPNGKITRAELVSIATRFFTTIEVGDSKFSDIAGHWAAKAIDEAYIKGIIKGYSDGTFRPDQAVTRAEAMKIVNGILGRPIDTCVLIEGIKLWPDVASDAWYYYVVAEATNAHRYELTTPEKWTEIIVDEIEY